MAAVLSLRANMARQRRPRDGYLPVDEPWKQAVLALLEKRGISRAGLARMIGASPSSITLLFKPETDQSRLVRSVHKVLDLGPPPEAATITERDDAKRRLDRIWADLTVDDRKMLLEVAERFQPRRH